MKRLVRQAIIFLVLLLVVTIVRLPYGSYRESYLPVLKNQATKAKIANLNVEDILLSFPATLTVTGFSAYLPIGGFPFPIYVESMHAEPSLLSLLLFRGALSGEAVAYSGTADFTFQKSLFGNNGKLTANIRNMKLESHPAFQALGGRGILNSELAADVPMVITGITDIEKLTTSFSITNGEIQGLDNFSPLIKIPAVSGISASAKAELKKGRLTLNDARLESSLGSAKGNGEAQLSPDGRSGSGGFRFTINLTAEGVRVIGGYLALAAKIPVDHPPAKWQVDVVLKPGQAARASVRPA